MRLRFGIIAALSFLAWSAHGAPDQDAWPCDQANTTVDMISCAEREFRKHDADMSRAYRELVDRAKTMNTPEQGYGPPPLDALQQSQRAWLAFRDADCHWKSTSFYGGTGQAVIAANCRAVMTRDRAAELRSMLAD
jgi:uncharacterized protein YecT (DUF1311 family)